MTRAEIQDLMAMIQGTYPNFNPPDKRAAVNAWHMALEDCDANQVVAAFVAYMKSNTSGFAPVPGQLIDTIHAMTAPGPLNEMEAWAQVSKAIRNSGYNSAEEFAKLPPLVQKAIGIPDQLRTWALDEDYSEDVVSSNFIKCYRIVAQREREVQKMPEKVRVAIEKANEESCLSQMEGKRRSMIESSSSAKQAVIGALEDREKVIPMPGRYKERLAALLEE